MKKKEGSSAFKLSKIHIAGIVLLAMIAFFALSSCMGEKKETAEWPTDGLAAKLPSPVGAVESVDMDDESLRATFRDCSDELFNEYVDACKEMGYTVDADGTASLSYDAYSDEGYSLRLSHYGSDDGDIQVYLDAPMEMSAITWPTGGAGSLAPVPSSTTGSISSDSSTFFYAYVGDTSIDEYNAYVDTCADAGFTVDYDRNETSYFADDAHGNRISLGYEGFNIMTVKVETPDPEEADDVAQEAEETPEPEPAEEPEPQEFEEPASSEATASGVSNDFKASMDEYEAYFDEYVEFMKAYNEDPTSLELIAKYGDMMKQYSETMEAMDAIDEDSLSPEDQAYFIEVQTRINQKLLEVAQ
ncbi:DUF6591 domain-containing protein [Collinsella tanakaei]|uniref:DUF6591 domain-containing protein n=1 Tax=Collinsella tanakaei TaxID=626935 RepID=UPI0025A42021|nr:DUF6591 domain-containing protein [Collinsella tanakaei]MDM8300214.1 hypothetical protein [Collinsella tanakaei]